MAGRTTAELTDLFDALRLEHAELRTRLDGLRDDFKTAGYIELRERLVRIESLLSAANFGELLTRVARLEEQTKELKEWKEKRDLRNWQFWLGIGMCIFTFGANIVIQLIMFFARKPA
jgi:hypothetical protein